MTSLAQSDRLEIPLGDNASLLVERKPFDIKTQKIDYSEQHFVIGINGRPVFGIDGDLPKFILTRAVLTIGLTKYPLLIDDMYNPWFGKHPDDKLQPGSKAFKLTNEGTRYRLVGLFSDGAGSYAAEWLIFNQSSLRTVISSDEGVVAALFGW